MTTKSIAAYVVAGLNVENHEVLMARIAAYCDKKPEVLDLLVKGIPVEVELPENVVALIGRIKSNINNVNISDIQIINIDIDSDFEIIVTASYYRTIYKTEDGRDWSSTQSEKYCVPTEQQDKKYIRLNVADAIKVGCKVTIV